MRTVWAIILLCLITSCGQPIPPGSVPGAYRGNHPYGSHLLTLNPDGTFTQSFVSAAESFTNSGSWSTYQKKNERRLVLTDFREVDSAGLQCIPSSATTVDTYLQAGSGRQFIIVNADVNIFFEKTGGK